MPQEQLSLRMDSDVIEKLRKYFPGKISELLEKKAKELISEMENTPIDIKKGFQITEDSMYVNYSPGKYMEKKQFQRIVSLIPKSEPITPEIIRQLMTNKIKDSQLAISKKGTWPGKVEKEV